MKNISKFKKLHFVLFLLEVFLIFSKFSKIKRLKQSKKTQFWKYSKIKQVFNFVKIWHILNLLVLKNIQNPKQYFCTCLILGTIVGRRQLCLQSEGFKPILSYQRLVPSIERLVPSIRGLPLTNWKRLDLDIMATVATYNTKQII